jgi:hypothetical protein
MQAHKVLGPYMVNVKLSRREQFAAWWATIVMFFVLLVPTLNSTILAYFTKQVRAVPLSAWKTATAGAQACP